MSIILVYPRGFCSGVTRAVEILNKSLEKYKKIYITEYLIHNQIFMKEMIGKGVIKVDSIDAVPEESTVIISAHGAPPKFLETCKKRNLNIVDSTCPIVSNIQNLIQQNVKLKKNIILIGHKNHPEIMGMIGYANTNVFIIENIDDIKNIPEIFYKNSVYFTQTTLEEGKIEKIIDALNEKIPDIESGSGLQTCICYATRERQNALRQAIIQHNPDLTIVVGSANSSNVLRLVEIARSFNKGKVVRIDTKDELNDMKLISDINHNSAVIITSGASTPEKLVQDIFKYIKSCVL